MVTALCLMACHGDRVHAPVVFALGAGMVAARVWAMKSLREEDLVQTQRHYMHAWLLGLACGAWTGTDCANHTPLQLVFFMSGNLLLFPFVAFGSTIVPISRGAYLVVLVAFVPAHWVLLQEMTALEATLGSAWEGLASATLALFVLESLVILAIAGRKRS